MGVWHIPWLYDLALRHVALHAAEHASYVLLGTLFSIPALCGGLDELWSLFYVVAGSITGWILALVLTFAQHPLYPAYAALPHRLGGLSPIADQQVAAGVMIAIGSIPYGIAVFVYLYRWLRFRASSRRGHGRVAPAREVKRDPADAGERGDDEDRRDQVDGVCGCHATTVAARV